MRGGGKERMGRSCVPSHLPSCASACIGIPGWDLTCFFFDDARMPFGRSVCARTLVSSISYGACSQARLLKERTCEEGGDADCMWIVQMDRAFQGPTHRAGLDLRGGGFCPDGRWCCPVCCEGPYGPPRTHTHPHTHSCAPWGSGTTETLPSESGRAAASFWRGTSETLPSESDRAAV